MDPIGTVRRENFGVHQYAIWVRQDPGYPDSEMIDTEWTCIWSTDLSREGTRIGCKAIEQTDHPIIGQVPGTPAETGADVEVGDRVRIPTMLVDEAFGTVIAADVNSDRTRPVYGIPEGIPFFAIRVDGDDARPVYLRRSHFELLEED